MDILQQAKTGLIVGLYHSAARDFTTYLWENTGDDRQSQEARRGLMQCALLLNYQGFNSSARTLYRTLLRLCPGTVEADKASAALSGMTTNRWKRAWLQFTGGVAGRNQPETLIQA